MKILFIVALMSISFCTQAQTFLSAHESMSPFCKVMASLMGLFVVGCIGYVVVKSTKGKDKTV